RTSKTQGDCCSRWMGLITLKLPNFCRSIAIERALHLLRIETTSKLEGVPMAQLTRTWPLALTLGLLAILAVDFGADSREITPRSERTTVPAVASAECRYADGPITLDGKLDEPAWQKASELKDFAVFWENRPPQTATKARLLWDDKYLYFAAEMEDTDLYADVKEHNGMCWFNDVFELFFKPSEKALGYYEFQ